MGSIQVFEERDRSCGHPHEKREFSDLSWCYHVQIKIPVIVQPSCKAFLLKFAGVVLNIFFRQPTKEGKTTGETRGSHL
jgi:hypothetical protein